MRALDCILLLFLMSTASCGARQAGDNSDDPQLSSPEWSACATEGEFETCAEVCAASGMECVANGCPAEPMYCKPESCEMATSMLGLGEMICTDPAAGVFVAASCDEPVEFTFTDTARCCCAEEI